MNQQAIRSACRRVRPELERGSQYLQNYFRSFSNTSALAEDSQNPTPPPPPKSSDRPSQPASVREKARAASSDISSLVDPAKSRTSSPGPRAQAQNGSPSPRVIDVRSLPRGRGQLRGRGGSAFRGRGGKPALSPGSRFAQAQGNRGGRGRGATNRGRGGARAGARGGGRSGRPRDDADTIEKKEKQRKDLEKEELLDPEAQAYMDAVTFGTRTPYIPSVTLESLADYMPSFPSGGAAVRNAAVMENLSALGTADPVGAPQALHGSNIAADLEANGLRFFADLAARDAAEKHLQDKKRSEAAVPADADGKDVAQAENAEVVQQKEPMIGVAEEAVKKVIVDRAVAGLYETPKFASDPIGIARNTQLRSESYKLADVERFEKKVMSLLGSAGAAKGGNKKKAQPQAKA